MTLQALGQRISIGEARDIPARLPDLPGGPFDASVRDFDLASGEGTDWFVCHLL